VPNFPFFRIFRKKAESEMPDLVQLGALCRNLGVFTARLQHSERDGRKMALPEQAVHLG